MVSITYENFAILIGSKIRFGDVGLGKDGNGGDRLGQP